MEWRPIDTAPKNRRLLLADNASEVVSTGYFDRWTKGWKNESDIYEDYGAPYHNEWEPTHWMPLPKPPSADE